MKNAVSTGSMDATREAPFALWDLVVAAGVYVLFTLLGRSVLGDSDIYWHIETGRWIFAHGTIPTADPFSHTMHGAPWLVSQWLGAICYAGAFAAGGWRGVLAISVGAVALAFAVQMRFLRTHLRTIIALEILVVAVTLMSGHVLARPHVLAYPVLAAWCAGLVGAADRGQPPPWGLLALIVLWANLHPSFVFGLAFIAPVALEALIAAPRHDRWSVALRWTSFTVAAAAAACMNPSGLRLFSGIARTLAMTRALALVPEWQPAHFGTFSALEFALLAGVCAALLAGIRLPSLRVAVLLGLAHMALVHVRHAELLALVAPLLIAAPVGRQLARVATPIRPLGPVVTGACGAIAVCAVLALTMRPAAPPAHNAPAAALASIRQATLGPILNDYQFGGYLIFVGEAPSIDGRADLYGEPFILRHYHALNGRDGTALRSFVDEHRIAATLLLSTTPAVALLDSMPDWRRVYSDSLAVAHVRR